MAGERKNPACGNVDCGITSTVVDTLSFGRGELNGWTGTWEIPCAPCARDWERRYPEDGPCWPFPDEPLAKGGQIDG